VTDALWAAVCVGGAAGGARGAGAAAGAGAARQGRHRRRRAGGRRPLHDPRRQVRPALSLSHLLVLISLSRYRDVRCPLLSVCLIVRQGMEK
jgi:hypothetical protein